MVVLKYFLNLHTYIYIFNKFFQHVQFSHSYTRNIKLSSAKKLIYLISSFVLFVFFAVIRIRSIFPSFGKYLLDRISFKGIIYVNLSKNLCSLHNRLITLIKSFLLQICQNIILLNLSSSLQLVVYNI